MNILECSKGQILQVVKLHAKGDLKERLISFGIMRGVVITLLEMAPGKSTLEIKVGKMRVALRAQEAELIEVQKYEYS